MEKFEYKKELLFSKDFDMNNELELLNHLGDDGWNLVSVVIDYIDDLVAHKFYFKRKIIEIGKDN